MADNSKSWDDSDKTPGQDQIEGRGGRVANVQGVTKTDSPDIELHDMGQGENTEVALRAMAINKIQYDRDQGVDVRYLIALDPDRRDGGGYTPPKPKDQSIVS
jgi:hypothetical protein